VKGAPHDKPRTFRVRSWPNPNPPQPGIYLATQRGKRACLVQTVRPCRLMAAARYAMTCLPLPRAAVPLGASIVVWSWEPRPARRAISAIRTR